MARTLRYLAIGFVLIAFVVSAEAAASRYRWKKAVISVSVSSSLTTNSTNIAAGTNVEAAIDRSFASWEKAANISLRQSLSPEQNVSAAGTQGDGISLITIAGTPENLAMFPLGLEDATARTRVFYDARGFITEADIVLNPYLQFSTNGTVGTFDLESTLTHEIGHLLGLGHSPVLGATMSEGNGKNGIFNLPSFSARTLSSDDIAAIRSLYGPAEKEENCCGRLLGKLSLTSRKPAANYTVWAEDGDSGRVVAAAVTQTDGSFRLGGLDAGKIRVYAQNDGDDAQLFATVDLGEFDLSVKQPIQIVKKLSSVRFDARPEYLGFNGQLADLSVNLNSGYVYAIRIGGPELQQKDLSVGSSSDLINIEQTASTGDFANGVSTVDFFANVATEAPEGEYSVYLKNAGGSRRFVIGGLTVEKFTNLWSVPGSK